MDQDRNTDQDMDRRIRERAYQLWVEDGRPEGRADDHWERARELVAIEENQHFATEPNPLSSREQPFPGEPVEPIDAVDNQGDFPELRDQGQNVSKPRRRRAKSAV